MKIIKIFCVIVILALSQACSGNKVEASKVGYQELSNSIKAGQRLQLVTKKAQIINIKVESLKGDIIQGSSLDDSSKRLKVNINDISKIRVFQDK